MSAATKHPRLDRYHRSAVTQQARYMAGEITRDQMLLNLRELARRLGVEAWVDWNEWKSGGQVLPWEVTGEAGAAGYHASQGGVR